MRICFEFLEFLKVYKKVICRVIVNIFGYIVKVIGFYDVLVIFLNNFKV